MREYAEKNQFPTDAARGSTIENLPVQRSLRWAGTTKRARRLEKQSVVEGKARNFINRKSDLIAVYIQTSGSPNKSACSRCVRRCGPWEECVSTDDAETIATYKGACGCCTYGSKATFCSFRTGMFVHLKGYGLDPDNRSYRRSYHHDIKKRTTSTQQK